MQSGVGRASARRTFNLLALAALSIGPASAADQIVLRHDNVSDARGLLNVFNLFRNACLDQPVSPGLADQLAPQDYIVVTSMAHLELDVPQRANAPMVISKTGTEQGDWDGGHPFVYFSPAKDGNPDGDCTVNWRRAWDYSDQTDALAKDMFAIMPSQVSYYLQAILRTAPPGGLMAKGPLSDVTDWVTVCWDRRSCGFTIRYQFDPDQGIDMAIIRRGHQG